MRPKPWCAEGGAARCHGLHVLFEERQLGLARGIRIVPGVCGNNKMNSSSWILKKWQYYFEERLWGSFYNLFESDDVKVKELIVNPGEGMSFQKHFKRSEIWLGFGWSCQSRFIKIFEPINGIPMVLSIR